MAGQRNASRFLGGAAFAVVGGWLMYSGSLGLAGAACVVAVFQLLPPTENLWAAHAMNWMLPAFALAFCVLRAVARDWWGLAFGSVFVGLAIANSVYREPSPTRTMVFRVLFGALAVLAIIAVWRFLVGGWLLR